MTKFFGRLSLIEFCALIDERTGIFLQFFLIRFSFKEKLQSVSEERKEMELLFGKKRGIQVSVS
jgi:hypothetical protein